MREKVARPYGVGRHLVWLHSTGAASGVTISTGGSVHVPGLCSFEAESPLMSLTSSMPPAPGPSLMTLFPSFDALITQPSPNSRLPSESDATVIEKNQAEPEEL